jgi:hypothetical protein
LKTENNERVFSLELKSKEQLKNVTLTDSTTESVLVEGTIGKLVKAAFEEGVILEVVGDHGTLRLDLSPDEIKRKTKNEPR